ncbi:malectin domain-containing carbohydrate-binding protein [Haladaptatus caseinilyticus]|uniref:malectin domain-containing carbohydrate-binding protein n=1 Tax=Haladaptatus caseinilyticus TaxID=2993314 RepID=UPI00224B93E0|nr:malectin domain-containing carbohydrate-binding protein [Haladaptatus caseinilyticus]
MNDRNTAGVVSGMAGRSSNSFIQGALIGGGFVFFVAGLVVVAGLSGVPFGRSPASGGAAGTTPATNTTTATTAITPSKTQTSAATPPSTSKTTSTTTSQRTLRTTTRTTSTTTVTTTRTPTTTTTTSRPRKRVLYRVNVGGPQIPANDGGPAWQADTKINPSRFGNAQTSGSRVSTTTDRISLTPAVPRGIPRKMFYSWRWDADYKTPRDDPEMRWQFPVEPGTYTVRLYFAETYLTDSGPNSNQKKGPRVFDVRVEDNQVLNNYNMYAELGTDRGTAKSYTVQARDGTLDVTFLHETEDPQLQGIEVVRVSDSGQNSRERPSIHNDRRGGSEGMDTEAVNTRASVGLPVLRPVDDMRERRFARRL